MLESVKFQFKFGLIFFFSLITVWLGLSSFFGLSPIDFLKQGTRILAAPIYASIYRDDIKYVEDATKKYRVGFSDVSAEPSFLTWKQVEDKIPGFHLISDHGSFKETDPFIPFVYEDPNAQYLYSLRSRYRLEEIIKGSRDEYDAMLRLGAWLGTRWDHGTDVVPGGNLVCDPATVIRAGEEGAKFWCEIAAKTTVHAATALGWQARLVTASRDGYTWEHAVAELWSNQFNKWFVMDTDFNVVYEHSGVPLSAFELSRLGEQLQAQGQLTVRSIAEQKKSLPLVDLIPFYNYVHVDMRNDWCSRPLRRGSPAGGDYSTWWTARPSLDKLLTAKFRTDNQNEFDWKLNFVAIYAINSERLHGDKLLIEIALKGYSPIFNRFELFFNDNLLQPVGESLYQVVVDVGVHTIKARFVNNLSYPTEAPISQVKFKFSP